MSKVAQALGLTSDREAAAFLESLFRATSDCVRLLSPDGRVLLLNDAGLAAVALDDLSQVRGAYWPDLWPEDARPKLEFALAEARAGRPVEFRAKCLSHQGEAVWWDTVVSPVRDAEGRLSHLLAVSRNVTISVETQTFFDTLVHLLPNPLLVKDAKDSRYVLINRAAEEIFGLTREAALGKTPFELFSPEMARLCREEDAEVVASRGLSISEEEPTETHSRGLRYFTTKKLATFDGGEPLHIVSLGEDVTERREAVEALRAAVAEAEAANRAKSVFLANMSHEIRTPLNGIVAGTDMLSRLALDARAAEVVEIIRSSGATLERLLSDILDMARIEAGEIIIDRSAFHLGEMVRSAAALSRLRADEKGVEVAVEIDAAADGQVFGDPMRTRQVLFNLLSNAVKFTGKGSVRVQVERLSDPQVRISVTDTGIGFDEATRRRVFERFQQADGSITRRFGGTGLGMSIARELVALMGGVIDCRSIPGAGASFWFDLPLPATDVALDGHLAELDETDRQLKVLLADDHPTNRKVVELLLQGFAEVTSVENGQDALRAWRAEAFDLVLMDMQMPVMDGLEAVGEMRRQEAADGRAPTPIVMLTANALPEHVAASQAAGANRHLEKPVTLQTLLGAMSEVLEQAGASAGVAADRVGVGD